LSSQCIARRKEEEKDKRRHEKLNQWLMSRCRRPRRLDAKQELIIAAVGDEALVGTASSPTIITSSHTSETQAGQERSSYQTDSSFKYSMKNGGTVTNDTHI
jgi:hypothetical protein